MKFVFAYVLAFLSMTVVSIYVPTRPKIHEYGYYRFKSVGCGVVPTCNLIIRDGKDGKIDIGYPKQAELVPNGCSIGSYPIRKGYFIRLGWDNRRRRNYYASPSFSLVTEYSDSKITFASRIDSKECFFPATLEKVEL